MFAGVQTIGAGLFAGLTLGLFSPLWIGLVMGHSSLAQLWATPKPYIFYLPFGFGIAAALWTILGFLVLSKLYDSIAAWHFGLRGEQAVAEKLADPRLAVAGYRIFHDLPAETGEGRKKRRWNVDHVIVGPGGVFVLETKTRLRRKATRNQEEDMVLFDGKRLQYPWCFDDKGARQAEANARWVRGLIAKFGPDDLIVRPVVVMPGWYVKSSMDYAVWAMNAKYLVEVLLDRKPLFRTEQLRPAIARLDEKCRVLEF